MTQEQLNIILNNLLNENKNSCVIDDPRNHMITLIVRIIINEDTKQEMMITTPNQGVEKYSDFGGTIGESVAVKYSRIRGDKEENWGNWSA